VIHGTHENNVDNVNQFQHNGFNVRVTKTNDSEKRLLFVKRHERIATRAEYYTSQSDEVSSVNANMAEPGRMHGLIWRSRAIADKEINDAILAVQALQICTTRNRKKSITIEH